MSNMKCVILASIIVFVLTLAVWRVWSGQNTALESSIQQTFNKIATDTTEQFISSNPLVIENLRKKVYESSEVTIEETLLSNDSYTAYRISYLSDGLKIFAAMNVPNGEGPFPIVILNHGYYNPSTFNTGDGTRTMADILVRDGYLTLASDYRGHGESESDGVSRGHRAEYSTDVLILIASVKNIEQADPERIGLWGHSMGGEVTLKVLEISDQIDAAVLWAPTSGNSERNYNRWARRFGGNRVLHQDRGNTDPTDSQSFEETSIFNYLNFISAPIQLHHGTSDAEVPYDWSVELDEKLVEAQKDIEFFTYEGQDHNFKNFGWGEISPRTVSFFDKYLGN